MIYVRLAYIVTKRKIYKSYVSHYSNNSMVKFRVLIKELESLAESVVKQRNVVMSVAFDEPSLAVDTHVERVSKRLGINRWKDNVTQVEDRLCSIIPKERWSRSHHQLIFFGRYHCLARKPKCDICPLLDDCREGQKRMKGQLKEA